MNLLHGLILALHLVYSSHIAVRALRWAGHVARMSEARLPKLFLSAWVYNARPNGRPQYTFGHALNRHVVRAFDAYLEHTDDPKLPIAAAASISGTAVWSADHQDECGTLDEDGVDSSTCEYDDLATDDEDMPPLLCCGYCNDAWHADCHDPPVTLVPAGTLGSWMCSLCFADMRRSHLNVASATWGTYAIKQPTWSSDLWFHWAQHSTVWHDIGAALLRPAP